MKFLNENGAIEEWKIDPVTGEMIHSVQHDITDLVERNKREFNDSDKRYKKPMEKIASIDGYAAYNWCQRKGISYEEFLRDVKLVYLFLGDPENACFKTKNARFKH